jgi:hypothetical protein
MHNSEKMGGVRPVCLTALFLMWTKKAQNLAFEPMLFILSRHITIEKTGLTPLNLGEKRGAEAVMPFS